MLLNKLLLPPNEAQIAAIKAELSEDTERFENNIKLLEQWLDCQPHLPKNYDRNILRTYLRGCKHDMEVAKRKFEMTLVAKTKMPEVFSSREYSENEMRIIKNLIGVPMPKLTPEGFRVVIIGLKTSDVDLYDNNIQLHYTCKFVQIRAFKDTITAGDIYVIDGANFKLSHITKTTFSIVEKGIFLFRSCCHMRIKNIYFINTPGYLDKLINAIKRLLPTKIKNRIMVDRGTSCLTNISIECLPKDYGGLELSTNELTSLWHQCFEENKEWFAYLDTILLIGPVPKFSHADIFDNFGTHGSFRQLNLD